MRLNENSTIDEVLEFIAEDYKEYTCYDLLKERLQNVPGLKQLIIDGINSGKIHGFDETIWNKIRSQNLRATHVKDTEEWFSKGYNIGNCTNTAIQLSYSFDSCYLCGGTVPLLEGTLNSEDGKHTWMVHDKKIYDTSLMMIIDEYYAKTSMKYNELNRTNPNIKNSNYSAAKDYATDPYLRRKK